MYNLGDVFFGRFGALYNVRLAQFFFTQASNPLIGKPSPYAYHQLSRTYFIQGKLNDSLTFAYKELSVYPDHQATYYIIGLAFGYMNREIEAIDAFSKYIDYNPQTWAARNDKAWLQFRIGDIDGALATISPVSNIEDNPWIQNTYGTLLMNAGKCTESKDAFTKALLSVNTMSEESWGKAYPGNDPRIYSTGLSAMKNSIAENVELAKKCETRP